MGQVAFDTHEFIETLENAGLPVEQAKAISLAVRKSHEAVDVATKRDLDDVHKDINARFEKTDAQIADVRKDMAAQFEKTDTQIADVRKDLSAEIGNVRKDMATQSEKTNTQIADVRKDMVSQFEKMELRMTIKLGVMIAAAVGIVAAVLRMPL